MRILYAEDNPVFQTMLRRQLTSWGYDVDLVGDGDLALQHLKDENPPHLAILDWSMPGLDGVEVCKRIRAIPRPYYIYLILITAHDGKENLLAGLEAGADDYLTKPVDLHQLRLRLRAAERVLECEERFRILFEEAPVAYHEIDRNGIIVRVNRAECALLGYRPTELIGRPVWEFVASDRIEESRQAVLRKLEGDGELASFERDYVCKNGKVLTVQIHENYIRDTPEHIIGIRSTLLDITDRKRQDKEIARHAAELARSNAELEQFAYVASHDLQEPLRMVASYTQLLGRRYKGKLDRDADEFIAFAVDGAHRMERLITDLLVLSRVGSRGGEFHPADANEVLSNSLLNLHSAITTSRAQVTCDSLPTTSVDALQLGQLFQNLIGNAIKFCNGAPPRVHVSAEEREIEWEFSVSDCGIGIDPKYSESIFKIFQRLHTAKEYPGTGIGLAICRKIVDRHGGRIWFASEPGKGTTFYFTVPKHPLVS